MQDQTTFAVVIMIPLIEYSLTDMEMSSNLSAAFFGCRSGEGLASVSLYAI